MTNCGALVNCKGHEKDVYELKCDISHFNFVFCEKMLFATNINDIIISVYGENAVFTIMFSGYII